MKFKLPFPINNNTIALSFVAITTLLFFISGALGVLDYIIIKILILGFTSTIAIIVSVILFKKSLIKNRLEENPKDDSD
ncbi:hypothetical protein [uncultured Winogradskyella sp.]|jgi:hypothetical protein|uniref:hypothetical protein n=1 Tax=uncultured Winogradskyella sp. TaxID=395353 RepID=UPI0025CEC4F4|nr:hypothetical protein [uncultured Winogradskyella sp.]